MLDSDAKFSGSMVTQQDFHFHYSFLDIRVKQPVGKSQFHPDLKDQYHILHLGLEGKLAETHLTVVKQETGAPAQAAYPKRHLILVPRLQIRLQGQLSAWHQSFPSFLP